MPSPFPGMDPFIEGQRFDDFHHAYVIGIRELLVPLVRPKYIVEAERYVYLTGEVEDERAARLVRPDLAIVEATPEIGASEGGTVATLEPRIMAVPVADEDGQLFLTIRTRDDRQVVTVIELLSPTNKDGGVGRREYLTKRANYLRTRTNAVEIDLLRGGTRLPTQEPLDEADYFAFVTRQGGWMHVEVYGWKLPDRLPVIPVPLQGGDPDVGLDLQAAFDRVYDASGYDYSLDYRREVAPELSAANRQWVGQRVGQ